MFVILMTVQKKIECVYICLTALNVRYVNRKLE